MSLHIPLPKTRTFRVSFHTSRLSLHGEVTIVALKFAMSSHFPLPKSRTTSDRKPKTNDQILPSHFRKGGSVSYIVREVRSVRVGGSGIKKLFFIPLPPSERQRKRDRRK